MFFGLTVAEHFRLGYRGERLDADLAYTYFPALAALRDRRAGLLSGGEQQMLTLGVALARKPRLMLVDELSLGLAPVIVERLMPVVSDLRQAERLRRAAGRAAHPHRAGRRRPGLRALPRRAGDPRPRRGTARRPPADPVRLPRRTHRERQPPGRTGVRPTASYRWREHVSRGDDRDRHQRFCRMAGADNGSEPLRHEQHVPPGHRRTAARPPRRRGPGLGALTSNGCPSSST